MGAELLPHDIPVPPPSKKELKKRAERLFGNLFSSGRKRIKSKRLFKTPSKSRKVSRSRRGSRSSRGSMSRRGSKSSRGSRSEGPGKLKKGKKIKLGTLKKQARSISKISSSMKSFYNKKRSKFVKKQ